MTKPVLRSLLAAGALALTCCGDPGDGAARGSVAADHPGREALARSLDGILSCGEDAACLEREASTVARSLRKLQDDVLSDALKQVLEHFRTREDSGDAQQVVEAGLNVVSRLGERGVRATLALTERYLEVSGPQGTRSPSLCDPWERVGSSARDFIERAVLEAEALVGKRAALVAVACTGIPLGERVARKLLEWAARHEDPAFGELAFESVKLLETADTVSHAALVEGLADREGSRRAVAAQIVAMRKTYDQAVVDGLVRLLRDPDLSTRGWAVLALTRVGHAPEGAHTVIEDLSRDSSERTRMYAVTFLALWEGDEAWRLEVLDRLVKEEEDEELRLSAAATASRIRRGK
jgi:hypothetical protein